MKTRAARLRHEIHRLAKTYHWPLSELRALEPRERLSYLLLIEHDEDAELFAGLLD